ncbi:MAG: LysM peptidoglycan-binding domain-containing protein [Candidatus Didemnitutus sp.]|nr:LysM peptidoglycan-binding domain-containing protein [Candidatus Didemnitutus sp.]
MRTWFLLGSLATVTVLAQPANNAAFELASVREDVRELKQRIGELSLTIEQLSRENATLQSRANQSYATVEQLNKAIAELNRAVQGDLAEQKREVLAQVAGQLERLGKQTNAALEALAKNQAARPAVQTSFSEDFPKQGVNYTVQTGDTLSSIAQKNGARLQDIINANKVSDPTKIRVGQTLFIPLAK